MKVLIVCGANQPNFNFKTTWSFVDEQMQSLKSHGVEFEIFLIKGRGLFGYLENLSALRSKIKSGQFDIVHAHYGLSGMLSVLQRQTPVITTFHGSDINIFSQNIISAIVTRLSQWNIFVSNRIYSKALLKPTKNFSVIPCGVNLELFKPMDKLEARKLLKMDRDKKYLLFPSAFDNKVKNFPLAKDALNMLNDVIPLELKDRSREEVNLLLNASDALLMTSEMEGSPQVIKEAMACNCPIISVDVGDVKDVIGETDNCFVVERNPKQIADKISQTLESSQRTNGRENIEKLNLSVVGIKIYEIYNDLNRAAIQ
ncbi:glycosyltransferase [Candidatus Marinimicrobia bacterium MT.SAG.3]|nr:glycosyltransferase [Candidatus Marinimicrobia bacterium MT.SAG.3]